MNVFLLVVFLILVPVLYWAGFLAPRRIWPWHAQVGSIVSLLLAALMVYVLWREHRTVSALRELIGPIPDISHVTYVPSGAELGALGTFLSTAPTTTARGNPGPPAAGSGRQPTVYWLVQSALSTDSVIAFFRNPTGRRGWHLTTDKPPWLYMARGSDALFVFVTDDWPRPGTKILLGYSGQANVR